MPELLLVELVPGPLDDLQSRLHIPASLGVVHREHRRPIGTVDDLLGELGFDAVFIANGAGLPVFMGIPGDRLLTRAVDLEVTQEELFGGSDQPYERLLEDAMEGDARRFWGEGLGMTEVEKGFEEYFTSRKIPVQITWRDLNRAYARAVVDLGGFVRDPGGMVWGHPRGADPAQEVVLRGIELEKLPVLRLYSGVQLGIPDGQTRDDPALVGRICALKILGHEEQTLDQAWPASEVSINGSMPSSFMAAT